MSFTRSTAEENYEVKNTGLLRVPPVHTGDALLYDALDLLEHVWVFFIDPVSQVSTVIQDLTHNQRQTDLILADQFQGHFQFNQVVLFVKI